MNSCWRILFFISIISCERLICKSFIYPIAYDDKNNLVFIMQQKTIYDLSLWLWDINKNSVSKQFFANALPGGIKILPGNKAFSFIDQGRLKVKTFLKRSPKIIDLPAFLYDISIIEWINSNICYFTAREGSFFNIYQFDINKSNLITLIKKRSLDCIYPQIIDNDLFYIERFTNYPFTHRIVEKKLIDSNENIILTSNKPIAFLFMKSNKEGFYLEHEDLIDREEKLINFCYYHLFNDGSNWLNESLFNFSLPLKYIFGHHDRRLYESILPFLPKHYNDKIIFSDSTVNVDKNLEVNIFMYDLNIKKLEKKTRSSKDQIFFSPIIVHDKCFYGFKTKTDNLETKDKLLPYFQI